MMQTMIYHQGIDRNQRKIFTMKRVLQFSLMLVVGIWLVYQMGKPTGHKSHSKMNGYGRGSNCLGRRAVNALLVSKPRLDIDIAGMHKMDGDNISNVVGEGEENEAHIALESSTEKVYSFPDENGIPQDVRDELRQIDENELDSESEIVVEDEGVEFREWRIVSVDDGSRSYGIEDSEG